MLKDGTFVGMVLIPLSLALLVVMAAGVPVVVYGMYLTQEGLVAAFTPSFVQIVVGVSLAFPFFVVLAVVVGLYFYRNRPILQANPTVNQYLGSDGKVMKEEVVEGTYREVPPSRQITKPVD